MAARSKSSSSNGRKKQRRSRYESARDPLAPRSAFYRRLSYNILAGGGLILVSLAIGVAGYAGFAGLAPVDAFLNAAMILGGMGPVDTLTSDAAKIFAGIYAIYSGVTIIGVATFILAPVVHRFLHVFHLENEGDES